MLIILKRNVEENALYKTCDIKLGFSILKRDFLVNFQLILVQKRAVTEEATEVGDESAKTMIRGVIVMNDQGKPRLVKFYEFQPVEKQQELVRSIYRILCSRAENVSNFVKVDSLFGPDARLVYKTYATLYFVFIFDDSENELAILDLMQVFVETLDKCFSNVCELDIVFNFNKVHTILDEIILGGQVLETSSSEVVKAVEEISRLERNANSIIGWQGR